MGDVTAKYLKIYRHTYVNNIAECLPKKSSSMKMVKNMIKKTLNDFCILIARKQKVNHHISDGTDEKNA